MKEPRKLLTGLLKCQKGQSMVEFCIVAPVLLIFLYGIIYLSDVCLIQTKLNVSSRYASWAKNRNIDISEDHVKKNIAGNFGLSESSLSLRFENTIFENLDENREVKNSKTTFIEEIVGKISDITGVAIDVVNVAGDIFLGGESSQTRKTTVSYKFNESHGLLNKTGVSLSSTYYVDGNSWNGEDVEAHDLMEVLVQTIKSTFLDIIFSEENMKDQNMDENSIEEKLKNQDNFEPGDEVN